MITCLYLKGTPTLCQGVIKFRETALQCIGSYRQALRDTKRGITESIGEKWQRVPQFSQQTFFYLFDRVYKHLGYIIMGNIKRFLRLTSLRLLRH